MSGLLGALKDSEFYRGLLENTRQMGGGLLSGTLGAPVDLMTMLMRPAGYKTPDKKVMGSSEHIGGLLGLNTDSLQYKVGSMLPTDATDAMKYAGLLGQMVYHGSPRKFDKFDASKAGTRKDGGGTSFGLGVNVSADVNHAKAYKEGSKGYLYKADLPDKEIDAFLQWEKPAPESLLKQLPPIDLDKPIPFGGGATIQRGPDGGWKLMTHGSSFRLSESEVGRMLGDGGTGEQVYRRLAAALGGDERAASKWLLDRGYKGIANNTEAGAKNYTVFDDSILKIISRE